MLEAGRDRITNRVVTIYCNTCPCLGTTTTKVGCAKKIIQVGIKEVVYQYDYGMDILTNGLLNEAGVLLRQIKPLSVSINR